MRFKGTEHFTGRRLREIRKERGLTARVLSDRTGFAENSILRIERGERIPSVATLEKLASGLGIPPSAVFSDCLYKQAQVVEAARALISAHEGVQRRGIDLVGEREFKPVRDALAALDGKPEGGQE